MRAWTTSASSVKSAMLICGRKPLRMEGVCGSVYNTNGIKYEESDEKAEDDDYGYSWRKETFVLRKNFETGMFKDHIEFLGRSTWSKIPFRCRIGKYWMIWRKWQDTFAWMQLGGRHFKTANRGSLVCAGYSTQWGPWTALWSPGLILEANINNGALLIEAQKIDWMTFTNEMDEPKNERPSG